MSLAQFLAVAAIVFGAAVIQALFGFGFGCGGGVGCGFGCVLCFGFG